MAVVDLSALHWRVCKQRIVENPITFPVGKIAQGFFAAGWATRQFFPELSHPEQCLSARDGRIS